MGYCAGEHGYEGDADQEDDYFGDLAADGGCGVFGAKGGHGGEGPVDAVPLGKALVACFEGAEDGPPGYCCEQGQKSGVLEALIGKDAV